MHKLAVVEQMSRHSHIYRVLDIFFPNVSLEKKTLENILNSAEIVIFKEQEMFCYFMDD